MMYDTAHFSPGAHQRARYAGQPVTDQCSHAPGELKPWLLHKTRDLLVDRASKGKGAT